MASKAPEILLVNIRSKSHENAIAGSSKQTYDDKPLLTLMKDLVNFMDNTVLTNSQLVNILQQEFLINIENLHNLEIEIYMTILKKFLKSWPKWGSIDLIVQKSKKDKSINIEDILNEEYSSLKLYLQEMLTLSKEPTEAAVKKIETKEPKKKGVLDVACSRSQLNKLFFQQPHPMHNNTIFYLNAEAYSKISVTSISFDEIFNWPFIILQFDSPIIEFKHKNALQYKHTLINNHLGSKPPPPIINMETHVSSKKGHMLNKKQIYSFLRDLSNAFKDNFYSDVVDYLLLVIKDDLDMLPDMIYRSNYYMYYLNKYPYVRYLSTKVNYSKVDKSEYDLELQEYLLPTNVFQLLRFRPPGNDVQEQLKAMVKDTTWLKITCDMCNVSYQGLTNLSDLKQHFLQSHCQEPDWSCSHCSKTFTMQLLAANKWKHRCCR